MPAIARNTDPISCGDRCANGAPSVQAENLPIVIQMNPSAGIDNPPTPAQQSSPNVFKLDTSGSGNSNYGVVRVGDTYLPHPGNPPHTGRRVTAGASRTFVNEGGGSGALIDFNIPMVNNGVPNPNAPATPPNMRDPSTMSPAFIQGNPNITQAEIQFYETDDPDTAQANPPSGTSIRSDKVPTKQDDTPPPSDQPPSYTCNDVDVLPTNFSWSTVSSSFDTWAQNFRLSPNFTVYDLTVGPAVSTYRFSSSVTQPSGLTQKQILTNMCYLTNIVLEPLRSSYGQFTITSGWRNASNNSQHNKGQAIDIQYLNLHGNAYTGRRYYERAQQVRDTINFDQLILEWFGKNPWLHISANPTNHRRQVLTQVRPNSYQPGLIMLG